MIIAHTEPVDITNSYLQLKVTTSNKPSADTNADVYVQLYGKEMCTQKKFFCSSKSERKKHFKKGQTGKYYMYLVRVVKRITCVLGARVSLSA